MKNLKRINDFMLLCNSGYGNTRAFVSMEFLKELKKDLEVLEILKNKLSNYLSVIGIVELDIEEYRKLIEWIKEE